MSNTQHPSERQDAVRRWVVLVAEDDILVRTAIAEYLREDGYAVIEAANAAEAMSQLASGTPVDVLFTDRQMPGAMDGIGLALWVHERHPRIHILLTSGYGDVTSPLPKIVFFPKPYALDGVGGCIRLLLDGNS